MKPVIHLIGLGLALCCLGAGQPQEPFPPSYALFIACNQYQDEGLSDLRNPIPNADSIAAMLAADYGFQTEILRNPSLQEIDAKLHAYAQQFQDGRLDRRGQFLVFFSGHGSVENGVGFFLPSDADPQRLRYTALDYPYWRGFLDGLPCQHVFVAIDACYSVRFDPQWASKPDGRFQRVGELSERDKLLADHAATRTRIFFTSDGEGKETPDRSNFAKKFQEGLLSSGGPDDILTSTELYGYVANARPRPHCREFGRDEPRSSFLFVRNRMDLSDVQAELKAWRQAKGQNTITAYEGFLSRYPSGDFAPLAQQSIQSLEQLQAQRREADAWTQAQALNTVAAYQNFTASFPRSVHVADANRQIQALEAAAARARDDAAYQQARERNSQAAYQGYLDRFPEGQHRQEAQAQLAELQQAAQLEADYRAWQKAKEAHTADAYQAYLDQFPRGSFAEPAQAKLALFVSKTAETANDIPDGFVFIKGGSFEMGDVMGDKEQTDETVHTVEVRDFYLAAKEVTFAEYDAFCEATGREKPDDRGWGRGERPVIRVDWYDCIEYCNWKSEQMGLQPVYTLDKSRQDPNNTSSYDDKKWRVTVNEQANGYRLPTEAEWEYAARQRGQKVRFGNGQNTADPSQMNFDASESYKKHYSQVGTYRKKTTPVGSFDPNSLGLYDMSGNVWEWCWDWYDSDYYASSPTSNPTGPSSGAGRVLRGGSWSYSPQGLRVAGRSRNAPDVRSYNCGFRPARSL